MRVERRESEEKVRDGAKRELRACLRISNGESKESDNLGIGELLNRYGKNHSH